MKKISEIENAYKAGTANGLGITNTFYWAYWEAKERKNQTIDFKDHIWGREIDAVFADLNRFGIKTFTVSATSTGLMETLAAFCERGCKVTGMVQINGKEGWNENFETIIEQRSAIKLQMPR